VEKENLCFPLLQPPHPQDHILLSVMKMKIIAMASYNLYKIHKKKSIFKIF